MGATYKFAHLLAFKVAEEVGVVPNEGEPLPTGAV